MQVGSTQVDAAKVGSLKDWFPCIKSPDKLIGLHHLDAFATPWQNSGWPGCFSVRPLSLIPSGLGVNHRGQGELSVWNDLPEVERGFGFLDYFIRDMNVEATGFDEH